MFFDLIGKESSSGDEEKESTLEWKVELTEIVDQLDVSVEEKERSGI